MGVAPLEAPGMKRWLLKVATSTSEWSVARASRLWTALHAAMRRMPRTRHGLGVRATHQTVARFARSGIFALGAAFSTSPVSAQPLHELCVVVGAPGEPAYAAGFAEAARAWQSAAGRIGGSLTMIGLEPENADRTDREKLRAWIVDRIAESESNEAPALWLVYLGHGSFDGREARLNLRGPDVTIQELATWLGPVQQPLVVVHGGSASAPLIPALSREGRILISATQSGHEVNYARFGERFAAAVASPAADIDQDGQTSVLEAFVAAAQQVQVFYAETGRLATEHALIDDNGDQQGTPAEWFRGTRVQRRADDGRKPDGERARLIALIPTEDESRLSPSDRMERDQWERELAALKLRKATLPEKEYYAELERLLRELAAIYRRNT
jgi:hypothetical protein